MPQAFESVEQRDAFLAEPRLAILMTNRPERAPMGVPVWFEWTGSAVLMFSARGTRKLKRLKEDPRAMVLVTNHVGEEEAWVSFEGEVEVLEDEDPWPLIERVAPRYWDMAVKQATLEEWRTARDAFVLLRLRPTDIRGGQ